MPGMALVSEGGAIEFFAHEFDDVAEAIGVAAIGGGEGFMGLEADFGAFGPGARQGVDGQAFRCLGAPTCGVLVDREDLIEAEAVEQFGVTASGVDDVEGGAAFLEAGGEACEGSHEGAVHACAFAQVDDDGGVGSGGHVFFDERFEGWAVEV